MYHDKDYEAECDFLEEALRRFATAPVRSILDLGCGTGGHAIPLAQRSYEVVGVDRSAQMIAVAGQKAQAGEEVAGPCFEVADIRKLQLGRTFDAAICMFAVLGYQTTNEALADTLRSARSHLKPGGLFLCDFWYGPAVLTQRPTDRVKIVSTGHDRVIRLTCAAMDVEHNLVRVSFRILRLRGDRVIQETEEVHPMRYIFRPELELFMAQSGFEVAAFCPLGQLDRTPDETTWNVSAIARAK
jgi:SAM-dependent methyltransferase